MGILLGLLSACFWGLADFLAARVSRQSGAYRTLFYAQLIGWSALSFLLMPQGRFPVASLQIWLLAGLLGLLNAIGSLAFYRALQIGLVSLVSPIASGFAAVTMVLALLWGERPGAIQLIGLVLTLVSVVSIARLSGAGNPRSPEGTKVPNRGLGLPCWLPSALVWPCGSSTGRCRFWEPSGLRGSSVWSPCCCWARSRRRLANSLAVL
jgi:uncharacterized membrane protein